MMKKSDTLDLGDGWRLSYTAALEGCTSDQPRIRITLRNEGRATATEFYNIAEGFLLQFGDDARIVDTLDEGRTIIATIDCTTNTLLATLARKLGGGGQEPRGATA